MTCDDPQFWKGAGQAQSHGVRAVSRSTTVKCDSCAAEIWIHPADVRLLNVEFDVCNLCQRRMVAWIRKVDESEVMTDGKLVRECK